jgi:hypothetical protein
LKTIWLCGPNRNVSNRDTAEKYAVRIVLTVLGPRCIPRLPPFNDAKAENALDTVAMV